MEKTNSGQNIFRRPQPFVKVKTGPNQESIHYSAFYEGIPEKFRILAKEELNETEENKREGLQGLKKALQGKGDEFVDDACLLAFLRNKKFNVNKAEAKLRKFIAKRRELTKMLVDMDMEKIENIVDDMGFGVLPYRDEHGSLICFTRPDGMRLEKYSMHELAVVFAFLSILASKYPLTTISGYTYLAECKMETSPFHVYYEFFKTAKSFLATMFILPVRIPRIDVLHTVSVIRWLMKLVSPLLSSKMIGRITFHGDSQEELHRHISPDILPDCFGGTMGPLTNDAYRDTLLDFIKETRKAYYS